MFLIQSQPYYIYKFFPKQTHSLKTHAQKNFPPNSPKPTQPTKIFLQKQTQLKKKFSPHCNKSYSFSFTFLLNFANFYSSSGENSLKFHKFLQKCKIFTRAKPHFTTTWKKFAKNLQKISNFKFRLSKNAPPPLYDIMLFEFQT